MRQRDQLEGAPKRRVLILGIGGPSGSCKTTLANHLTQRLPCVTSPISMDSWFDPGRMPFHEDGRRNWETPAGVDHKNFIAEVRQVQQALEAGSLPGPLPTPRGRNIHLGHPTLSEADAKAVLCASSDIFLIIEGFLLFFWPEVSTLCDVKVFLADSAERCGERRYRREAGHRGGDLREYLEQWFLPVVWKHYQMYLPVQLENLSPGMVINVHQFDVAEEYCKKALAQGPHAREHPTPIQRQGAPAAKAAPAGAGFIDMARLEKAIASGADQSLVHLVMACNSHRSKASPFQALEVAVTLYNGSGRTPSESVDSMIKPFLVRILRQTEFPNGQATLRRMTAPGVVSTTLSKPQCTAIVAAAFLGLLPKFDDAQDDFHYLRMHSTNRTDSRFDACVAKIVMVLDYFRQRLESEKMGATNEHPVTFLRVARKPNDDAKSILQAFDNPKNRSMSLGAGLVLEAPGRSIDDERGGWNIRVDFANKFVGGGFASHGAVQEEILFSKCPEMGCARFLMPEHLEEYEAAFILGAEQFTTTLPGTYDKTLKFGAPFAHREPLKESIVAVVDAQEFRAESTDGAYKPHRQYAHRAILRELVKLLASFELTALRQEASITEKLSICTGNWGCGVFGGDIELKFLLQLCVCRLLDLPMRYFPFDSPTAARLQNFVALHLPGIARQCSPFDLLYFLLNEVRAPIDCEKSVFDQLVDFANDCSVIRRWNFTSDPSRTNLVMLLSGALSPIHRGHFEGLRRAAQSDLGRYHCAGFALSPSSTGYVNHKLGTQAMTLSFRISSTELAVEDEARETGEPPMLVIRSGLAQGIEIANLLGNRLKAMFPGVAIACLPLYGSDFAIKHQSFDGFVCVYRKDAANTGDQVLAARARWGPSFLFIPESSTQLEISSTDIRQGLLHDDGTKLKFLFPSTLEKIRLFGEQVFSQPSPTPRIAASLTVVHPTSIQYGTPRNFGSMPTLRESALPFVVVWCDSGWKELIGFHTSYCLPNSCQLWLFDEPGAGLGAVHRLKSNGNKRVVAVITSSFIQQQGNTSLGCEFLHGVKEIDPSIPRIMISGSQSPQTLSASWTKAHPGESLPFTDFCTSRQTAISTAIGSIRKL
jgi:uridine kinase